MDDEETWLLLASAGVTVVVALRWYERLLAHRLPLSKAVILTCLSVGAWPAALLLGLRATLMWGAAREVRLHGEYIALFVALGAVWFIGLSSASGWLGVHAIDDVIERRNVAATLAFAGTTGGGMIVYAGANLGEGDTIWTTIGPAALASALALALWGTHQALSGAADAITLDRDLASAARFAGMTLGTSLIIARAVAGDYVSVFATVHDLFAQSWPALLLAAISALFQVLLRPTRERPRPRLVTRGLVPALAFFGAGAAATFFRNLWCSAGVAR